MKFEKLQEKNEQLREKINDFLRTEFDEEETKETFLLINQLVENEIKQEEYCN